MSSHTHRSHPSSGRTAGRACRYMRRRTHHWLAVRMFLVGLVRSDLLPALIFAVAFLVMFRLGVL